MTFRSIVTDISGGRVGIIKGTPTVWTDANVKALPTTPLTFVAAQGANTWARLVGLTLNADFSAGAYTNVNAAAYMFAEYAGGSPEIAGYYIPNDSGVSLTKLTTFLGANDYVLHMGPYVETYETSGWGAIPTIHARANIVNVGIRLTINNGGSGNLTGGNAANTLTATPYYLVESI